MNIEKLIYDLRTRINPQYYDQIGTESYERHQVVKALEYLQQENERQRFDILAMNQSMDLLRDENTRIRENAKTIGELEQLATRSNNNMLVEIEQLREQAEKDSVQIELLEHKLESFKDENELLKNDAERLVRK